MPYAEYLEPFGGEPERDLTHDTLRFDGDDFRDVDCGGAGFTECAFTSVSFTGGRCRRVRFNDVWFHTVRWVGTDLVETSWMDAEVVSGMLAGVEVHGSALRRVTFFNCKFDSVNVRAATLRDVHFVDCLLRDVDLAEARLDGVTFPGSTLDGVRFDGARMKGVDLRGAVALGVASGHGSLRGAIVDGAQLLDLAPALARELGIEVRDGR
nr:pentapeptide repeat-containing protein [Streptomyces taklimakanensis]